MEDRKYSIGSLFDGIGGFPLVASWYGIEPIWASEIEPSCVRITSKHFPDMKHYGDITKMKGDEIEPVDVLTGGSPCQDLSLAGKQSGIKRKCPECGLLVDMHDETDICSNCGSKLEFTRSGLFMEQVRIIKEMRDKTNGEYPKFVIWENVGAAISSNNGEDFFTVLKEFCSLLGEKLPSFRPEKWVYAGEILADSGSIAWRTFDAQYWGVPQRRRRIYLVLDFTGQRAGEILFKQESLRRDFATRKKPWERTSRKIDERSERADSENELICVATQQVNAEIMVDKCPTLTEANGTSGSNRPYIVYGFDGYNSDITGDVSATLGINCGTSTGRNGIVVDCGVTYDTTVYGICSLGSNSMKSDNPNSGFYEADVVRTLDTSGSNPACNQGGNVIVQEPVYCLQGNGIDRADTAGCNGRGWNVDVCYTLNTIDRPAVVYTVNEDVHIDQSIGAFLGGNGSKAFSIAYSERVCPTLKTGEPPSITYVESSNGKPYVAAFAHQVGGCVPMMPYNEELSPTLTSKQTMAVVISNDEKVYTLIENHSMDCRWTEVTNGVCPTLSAAMGTGGNNTPFVIEEDLTPTTITAGDFMQVCTDKLMARDYKDHQIVFRPKSIVRRLTPLECERLQGFPDNWTAGESDANRYKALGNSVALPCVDYIMYGIREVLDNVK